MEFPSRHRTKITLDRDLKSAVEIEAAQEKRLFGDQANA